MNLNSTILQSVDEAFRVENRKARPKIIKNINNIQHVFILPTSKDSNSSLASEKKKRIRRNIAKLNEVQVSMTEVQRSKESSPTNEEYFFTFYKDSTQGV